MSLDILRRSLAQVHAYAGGVVGEGGTVSNCYTTASVSGATTTTSGTSYVGGISGKGSTVENSYTTGVIAVQGAQHFEQGSLLGGVLGYGRSASNILLFRCCP